MKVPWKTSTRFTDGPSLSCRLRHDPRQAGSWSVLWAQSAFHDSREGQAEQDA